MYQKSAVQYDQLFSSVVTLLIRRIRHFNQILNTSLCACVVSYLTKFERENACEIYQF